MKKELISGHTEDFWSEKFQEYQKWVENQKKKGIIFVTEYKSKEKFIDAWDSAKTEAKLGQGTKDIYKRIKWESLWNTKIKVAYGFKQTLSELDINVDLETLRRMSHEELIDKYEDQIKKHYKDLKDAGMSPNLAGKIISDYWFRSL